MGKIIINSDRGAIPSNTPVGVVARVQIVPAEASEQRGQQIRQGSKSIILLDNSGSMEGDKLDQAKEAAIQYYKSLKQGDTITIATFSDTVSFLMKEERPFQTFVESLVRKVAPDGGTNMYSALTEVDRMFSISSESQIRASFKLVLLTDGVASDGGETEFIQISAKFQKLGIPMYILGIGADYNEDLLLKMYRANEIGFFNHLTDITGVIKQFDDISKQVVLYPSRDLTIKLTPGSKLNKVYKFEPQILELDPKRIGDNLYTIPLGNLGTENQKILAKIELPARTVGDFREGTFTVEMNSPTSGPLIIKRSEDLNSVKQSMNVTVQSEFAEAELKVLGLKALDKSDPGSVEAARVYTRKIEGIKNNPVMTKKLGEVKMKELVDGGNIIIGTKKVTDVELKERKAGFTKKRD